MPTPQFALFPVRARSALAVPQSPMIRWNQPQKPRSLLRFDIAARAAPVAPPRKLRLVPTVVEPAAPAPAPEPAVARSAPERVEPPAPVPVAPAPLPLPFVSPAPRRPLKLLRPTTRGECAGVPRPCPFVSCRHHLALDISRRGVVLVTDPTLRSSVLPDETFDEITNPRPSCSLDVADQGGRTLDEIADMMGLTRERIRQIETEALRAVRGDVTMQTFRDDFDEGVDVKPVTRDDAFDAGLFEDEMGNFS